MRVRNLGKAGHAPSLVAAFAHLDASSVVWVLLGALGVTISARFHLSATEKGVLVGVPLVAGSAFRVLVGVLADRWGPKPVGVASLLFTAVPLLWGWLAGDSFGQVLAIGLLLGVAGASAAVSLPLASRCYPQEYQGVVMGIVGAGNTGTAIATFFAPRLVPQIGWHGVFGLALVPTVLTALGYAALARNVAGSPRDGSERGATARVLRDPALIRFCAIFLVTFGGFVGLVSFLPILFHDQFGLSLIQGADDAALAALTGGLLRPVGGYLADRAGGLRVATGCLAAAAVLAAGLALLPALGPAVALLVLLCAMFGAGNGAVYQLISLRFGRDIGKAGGLVSAAGGLGGFLLPFGMGWLKDLTGSYGTGFAALGAAAASCLLLALWVSRDADARLVAPIQLHPVAQLSAAKAA